MNLLTCTGCKHKGACDKAADMRAKLKGLGVRSLKFACPKREDIYQPGQPVVFTTYVSERDGSGWGRDVTAVVYKGYVIKQYGGKVFGFIKPDTRDETEGVPFQARSNGYVKIILARVQPDPTRPTVALKQCGWCGQYPGIGARCDKDPNCTPASGCLADQGLVLEDAA